eukprot:342548_1
MIISVSILSLILCIIHSSISTSTLNLYNFEDNILPKYINAFTIDFYKGQFNFIISNKTQPSIYGISDMLHVLYLVDQIDKYLPNTTIINSWINQIYSMQNSSGFYKLQSLESTVGYQPWHSIAFTSAALYVLNATPKYDNTYYGNIASNSLLWNSTFYSLLNYSQGIQQGCDSIHSCSHKIVSIPATIFCEGNQHKYHKFISWWFNDFMFPNLNTAYGVLCPEIDIEQVGIDDCLGS